MDPQNPARPQRWLVHVVLAAALVVCVGAVGVGLVFFLPERDTASSAAPPTPSEAGTPAPAEDPHATWPELPVLPADTAPSGTGSGVETTIAFENHSAERHLISWLEEDGTLTAYSTLEPGYTYDQTSYSGHYWQVATADGTAVAVFRAADEPSRAIIR
jgi:hypothetical protein